MAECRIDSSLAGALVFATKIPKAKMWGIIIAFAGSMLLLFNKGFKYDENLIYCSYIVFATLLYGININLVQKYLHDVGSLKLASLALSMCAIPALTVLYFTGYFSLPLADKAFLISTVWSCILGVAGTAAATVLFYILIKRAGAIFSSMVTYGIPFVAMFWGLFLGEEITLRQVGALALILFGIYIASRSPREITKYE